MSDQEPDPGFSVVDRRRRGDAADAPAPAAAEARLLPPRETPSSLATESAGVSAAPPRADLASFCMMLYGDALVHLGQVPDPMTGQPRPDPHQARFLIDLLGMLKEKTEGNRTPEESAALDQMLSNLRLAFVHASRRT